MAGTLAGITVLICVGGAIAQQPVPLSHHAALYTWYSPSRGDHFTTTDPAWAGAIGSRRNPDYRLIRIEGSVLSANFPQPPDTVPLYSFWNRDRNDNFLTSDPAWTSRTSGDGYNRFRLEGYLYADPKAGTRPLVSLWSDTRRDNFATTDPRLALPLNQAVGNRTDTIANATYRTYRIEGFMLPPAAADDIHQPAHAANLQQIAFGDWRPLMPSEQGVRPAGALQRANARFTSNLVIVPLEFSDIRFGSGDFARYTRFATSTDPLSLEAGVRSLSRGRFTWRTTLTPIVRDPLTFDQTLKLDDAWRAFHRVSQRLDGETTIRWSPELFQRRHGFSLDVYDLDGDGVEDDEINIRSRVLKLASQFIRFDQFDANGDGRVDSSELVVLRFGADPGIGGQMGGSGDVTARGKRIATSVGLVAKDTTRAGLIHELLHIWGGTDIYGPGFQLNSRNSLMAAMAGNDSFWDLDPWHLAKFGWVRPRFIAIGPTGSQSGGIEPMQAAGHDEGAESARPVVFFDPSRGLNEYFLAQYRTQFPKCPGSGFLGDLCSHYRDNGVADTGIAVWHVMTNADGSLRDIRKIDDRGDRIAWPVGTPDDGHMFRLGVVDPVDGKLGRSRYLKEGGQLSLRWWDGTDSGLRIRVGLLSPTSQVAVMEWRDVSRAFTPRLDILRVTGFPTEDYPTVNAGQRIAFDGLFGINANAVGARLVSESGGEYPMQTVTWSPTRMLADVPSNAPPGRYRLVVAPPGSATNSPWRSNGLRLQIPLRTLSIPSLPRDFDQRVGVPTLRDLTPDFDRLDLQPRPLPAVPPLSGSPINPHGYGGELLVP